MLKNLMCTILLAIFCLPMFANNIALGTATLTDENVTEGCVYVTFDVTWEHSWRMSSGASNWDAAWLFVKYRVGGVGGNGCLLTCTTQATQQARARLPISRWVCWTTMRRLMRVSTPVWAPLFTGAVLAVVRSRTRISSCVGTTTPMALPTITSA